MWKTISSKEVFTHPRLSLIEDEVELPNGSTTTYLRRKDDGRSFATVIAKREDGKILIQKEYSYPPNEKLFQFPGGHVPSTEKPEAGANRELMEEAGLMANNLQLLGAYLVDNRRSTAKMHVFLATDLIEKSLTGDPEEEMESFWFSEEEIAGMIHRNEFVNCHLLAAWSLYSNRDR